MTEADDIVLIDVFSYELKVFVSLIFSPQFSIFNFKGNRFSFKNNYDYWYSTNVSLIF